MVVNHEASVERLDPNEPSPIVPLAQAGIAALLGVFVLPGLFAGPLPTAANPANGIELGPILWLGGAALLVGWLVGLAPSLAGLLAHALATVPWRARSTDDRPGGSFHVGLIAALLVIGVDLALFELIARRPLVAVVGVSATTAPVDAIVASATLVALLAVLIRLYLAGRPFLETGAWYVLDSVVPTVSSDAASRFAAADATLTRKPESRSQNPEVAARTAAATIVATVLASSEPTLPATVTAPAEPAIAATVVAPPAETTVVAPVTAPLKPTVAATVPAETTIVAMVAAPAEPTIVPTVIAPAADTTATVVANDSTCPVPTSDATETLPATIPSTPRPA